ncbi:ribosomal RNA small subunit methyltransferase G [bacterium BMS3Abin02]|nr:ribosomal RNA small subunit methyltransferase G [bacterium BMS3Abin02]
MKHDPQPQISEWLGVDLSSEQRALLEGFERWLSDEAIPAGLLSPGERDRIWARHIVDSLSFSVAWTGDAPQRLIDAGSGGGLPGIPLAIAFPQTAVTLLDRSSKSVRLLRRAIRVLGLANTEAIVGDVREQRRCEAVTMRAVLRPPEAVEVMRDVLMPGGRGVIGLAHRRTADPGWRQLGGRVVEVSVLDPTGWLLIMQQRGHRQTHLDRSDHQPEGRSG